MVGELDILELCYQQEAVCAARQVSAVLQLAGLFQSSAELLAEWP